MSLRLGKHNLSVACPKRKKHKQPKNRSKNHQQRSPKLLVSWYLYYFFANALHGRKFNDTEMAQDKPIWPNKGQHKPQNTPKWLNMSPIWCRHSPQWPNISPSSGKHSLSAACPKRKKQKQPKKKSSKIHQQCSPKIVLFPSYLWCFLQTPCMDENSTTLKCPNPRQRLTQIPWLNMSPIWCQCGSKCPNIAQNGPR